MKARLLLAALTCTLVAAGAAQAGSGGSNRAAMAVSAIVISPGCRTGQYASAAERDGCAAALAALAESRTPLPVAMPEAPPVVTRSTDAAGRTSILRLY